MREYSIGRAIFDILLVGATATLTYLAISTSQPRHNPVHIGQGIEEVIERKVESNPPSEQKHNIRTNYLRDIVDRDAYKFD